MLGWYKSHKIVWRSACMSLGDAHQWVYCGKKNLRACYFWITIEGGCWRFIQRCHTCHVHGDLIKEPPHELNAMSSLCPFAEWGIDFIRPIYRAASNGHKFIFVSIDYNSESKLLPTKFWKRKLWPILFAIIWEVIYRFKNLSSQIMEKIWTVPWWKRYVNNSKLPIVIQLRIIPRWMDLW